MQRHEVWLAVVVNAVLFALACALTHAYAAEGTLPPDWRQLATVIVVVLLALGVSALALVAWLKR
jgi:hypothetical protein